MPITIRTQYDTYSDFPVPHGVSHSGSSTKPTYSSYYDSHGVLQVEQDGVINLYEEIQSHKDSTDIHVLIERFHQGDLEIMERMQQHPGVYADVTGMPKTYAELLNTLHHGEQEFMQLPVEVRSQFGHSYEQWLAAMDNMPLWRERMGFDKAQNVADAISSVDTPASVPVSAPSVAPAPVPALSTTSEVKPNGQS